MQTKKISHSIEIRKVSSLKLYAKNARNHSSAQVDVLAAAIAEFGFRNPVIISPDGTVRAGHGRIAAARRLGLEEIPCIELGDLTDMEARAFAVADNQIADLSDWDELKLAEELRDLEHSNVNLDVLGFSDDEMSRLAATLEATSESLGGSADASGAGDGEKESAAKEPPSKFKPGDMWILGETRLMCADHFDKRRLERFLDACTLFIAPTPLGLFDSGGPYLVGMKEQETGLRSAYFVELEPANCLAMEALWEKQTGRQATRVPGAKIIRKPADAE